jgi:Calx-beta domain-containing protein
MGPGGFDFDNGFGLIDANATLGALSGNAVPQLSVADVSTPEGSTTANQALFAVSLSAPSGQTVSVDFATSDGTATAGSDYQSATGKLTFAPGETTKQIAVNVTPDTALESNETFSLTLTNPTNASLARSGAVGTILEDDGTVVSVEGGSKAEGKKRRRKKASFLVSLNKPATSEVTVQVTTGGGTATSGKDYRPVSELVRFAPGASQVRVKLVLRGDRKREPDETLTITLSNPVNATLGTASAEFTILNDD